MKRSRRGGFLPESFEDFQELKITGFCSYSSCHTCKRDFSQKNIFTPEGWRESQISAMCEKCFDELFADSDAAEDEGV